ncbi:Peptidase family M28 [uncultured archaeon]|nr:Peptidase family M28 [uncultured archaeon]
MKKQLVAVFLTLVMIGTSVLIMPDDMNVQALSGGENGVGLDNDYIKDIAQELSNIVNENETYGRGRDFGTYGEELARLSIVGWMQNLGLEDPTSGPYPYRERITSILYPLQLLFSGGEKLNSKIEINSKHLTINNLANGEDVDCYIKAVTNGTRTGRVHFFPEKERMKLTHNFTGTNLSLIPKSMIVDRIELPFFQAIMEYISTHLPFRNPGGLTLDEFIKPLFEEYYDFTFETIDPNDNSTWPSFVKKVNLTEDCVTIEEDPSFNPNFVTNWEGIRFLHPLWDEVHSGFTGIFDWFVSRLIECIIFVVECVVSECFPNLKAEIRYDYTADSYNTRFTGDSYIPIIYINGSIGNTINQSLDDYSVTYWLNQTYNNNVESYNVIGQISGTDPSKTVIVCSLYDSLWCQGTADSAVGCGTVLALAKYMKNHSITPKYNIKFILFSGEEWGYKGARHYQATHKNENITAVIDLNQLGMKKINQNDPELFLNLLTNNIDAEIKLIRINCLTTNYQNRTGYGFRPMYTPWGTLSNDFAFAFPNLLRDCKTICFLKDCGWYLHHRDGMNHTAGDTMSNIDWDDLYTTAELVWNVTKYFTIDPNCFFKPGYPTTQITDSNHDGKNDRVNVTFSVGTIMPQDRIRVEACLIPIIIPKPPNPPNPPNPDSPGPYSAQGKTFNYIPYQSASYPLSDANRLEYKERVIDTCIPRFIDNFYKTKDYTIYKSSGINDSFVFNITNYMPNVKYKLTLKLSNSTGIIDLKENNTWSTTLDLKSVNNGPDINIHPNPIKRIEPLIDQNNDGTPEKNGIITLTVNSTDPDPVDTVEYQACFTNTNGDTEYSEWTPPTTPNTNHTEEFTWMLPNTTQLQIRTRDNYHAYNQTSSWSDPISIPFGPSCRANITPTVELLDEELIFKGLENHINNIQSWEWNFDDATTPDTIQNTTHSFNQPGTYNITLNVTEQNDTIYSYNTTVQILYITANYTEITTVIQPNQTIAFTDASDAYYTIQNWTWDFDDGTNSYDQNPSHNFTTEGAYTVNLTVTDNQSHTHTLNRTIYVDTTPPEILLIPQPSDTINLGSPVTLNADFFDALSGVQNAAVNITYPNNTTSNQTMTTNHSSPDDYEYTVTDTWQTGQYFYRLWVRDYANNTNFSTYRSFTVCNNFGNTNLGAWNQSISNRITGTVFTCHENGTADSITMFIKANESTPPKHLKAMIYTTGGSLLGTTEEKNTWTGSGSEWMILNFTGTRPTLTKDTEYQLVCWSNDPTCILYYENSSTNIGRYENETYGTPPNPFASLNENREYSLYCSYSTKPVITLISQTQDTVGFGFNTSITTCVSDAVNGVDEVLINIDYPNNISLCSPMEDIGNNTYSYVFSDTWLVGQYNYSIIAYDRFGRNNTSTQQSFNASANATLSISTLVDTYSDNETINLTDPPAGGDDDDNNSIVEQGETWNTYYNTTTRTYTLQCYGDPINYKDEEGQWNPINCTLQPLSPTHPAYRYGYVAGNEKNVMNVYFKRWSNATYPVAFTYDKDTDPLVRVVRSKLIGIGYVDPQSDWGSATIQTIRSSRGTIQGNTGVYPGVFTGVNASWMIENGKLKEELLLTPEASTALRTHPPSNYGLNNQTSWLVWVTQLNFGT